MIIVTLNTNINKSMTATMNMEDKDELKKGQWASLETVKQNLKRSGVYTEELVHTTELIVQRRIYRMIAQLPDEDLITLFQELKHQSSNQ